VIRALAASLALCAMLGAAVAAEAPGKPVAPAVLDEAASHQVLVMLRQPAPHFRPDSTYGGYSGDAGLAARRRVAAELARTYGLTLVNEWPMAAIGVDCFVMEEPGGRPVAQALAALAQDPRVLWAQAVNLYEGMDATGDPLYPVQPASRDWQLAALHRASTGRRVAVAVIDSGVDGEHPDLLGQVALRKNFVDASPDAAEAHGTAVAGIIAARSGNGVGIAGIAPGARLMALRACWEAAGKGARCNSFTLGQAINFALLRDAQVINLSLAGPPDRLLQALLDAALARGVAVVGAVDPGRAGGGFPASHPGVLSVAAAGSAGALPAGGLRAPGSDVPTCVAHAGWALVSGSSYAAAHVSGLVALLLELQPALTGAQLHSQLDDRPGGPDNTRGAGARHGWAGAGSIGACAAIARAAGACVCLCPSTAAATAIHPR
jgi:subtilisin family serine protease